MSETPTPRTDALVEKYEHLPMCANAEVWSLARQLERELAAMREERAAIKSGALETHTAFCKLGFEAEALRERAEKAERERDEAQELMESESSWADGYHSHWVKAERDLAEARKELEEVKELLRKAFEILVINYDGINKSNARSAGMSERCELCGTEVVRMMNAAWCRDVYCAMHRANDAGQHDRIQSALRLLKRVESGESVEVKAGMPIVEMRSES